jgi:hypothetical protein
MLVNKRVVFLGSLYDQEKFFEQLSMAMVTFQYSALMEQILPRQMCKSVDIIFPYFAPGTMERVEKEGNLLGSVVEGLLTN